jgi:hypothetical protein
MDPAPAIRWCRKGHAALETQFYRFSQVFRVKDGKSRKPYKSSYCIACDKVMMRERDHQKKLQVLAHYGRICQCCSEGREEFLSIDHINGDGAKHRKEIGGNGSGLYWWLVKNNFPPGFQVLCFNCNISKGLFGYCPHQKENSSIQTSTVE